VSFNQRLRRLFRVAGGRGATAASSLRNAAQLDVYGTVRRPGPFDLPPVEPVVLQHPLPWELSDGDESARVADWVNRPSPPTPPGAGT
jgi:hypothetical protein